VEDELTPPEPFSFASDSVVAQEEVPLPEPIPEPSPTLISNVYVPIFEKLHVCEKQLIEAVHDIQFIWLNFSVKQTPFLRDHYSLSLEDK